MKRSAAVAALAAALAACGGGGLTVTEFAAEGEELVAAMEAQFQELDSEWESQTPTVEGARRYWDDRLTIRHEFLEGIEELEAPDEVAAMHARGIDIFGRITAADEALAEHVATWGSITDHWAWVDTPEGQASDALLEEVWDFCRSAQAEFDATAEREAFDDLPWVPSEMTEVVSVAFGCPPQDEMP